MPRGLHGRQAYFYRKQHGRLHKPMESDEDKIERLERKIKKLNLKVRQLEALIPPIPKTR
jgi:hypothetical protein